MVLVLKVQGLGLEGPNLGLENCIDNYLASPPNARKTIKLIVIIISYRK